MIIDSIKSKYNGRIRLMPPIDINNIEFPKALIEILAISNGIMETMDHPKTGEKIDIGWIIYSYEEICKATSFYNQEYGFSGIVFSTDGAGNPYYIDEGKIYEFDPIDNESTVKADSLEAFFKG